MPLESGTTISDLNELWPLGSDFAQDGDNHLRLIKAVLKTQFPGVGGSGFATPITATEAELNYLDGLTGNVQDQLDVLNITPFDAGVIQLFYQASAPTNWTQININDGSSHYMVRAVGTGEVGGIFGGDYDLATYNFSHTHSTTPHALVAAEIPDLSIELRLDDSSQSDSHQQTDRVARGRNDGGTWHSDPVRTTGLTGTAHDHGDTSAHAETTFPLYANFIVCQYDGAP